MFLYYKNTFCYLIVFLSLIMLGCKPQNQGNNIAESKSNKDSINSKFMYGIRIDSLDIEEFQIKSGDNLSSILNEFGFSLKQVDSITRISNPVLDPKKLRPGNKYVSLRTQDSIQEIKYIVFEKSNVDFSILDFTQAELKAYEFNKKITIKTQYSEGKIESSLWNTIAENGDNPLLSLKLSDIYAWQIDFFDIKKGDDYQVIYDVAYIDDSIPLYIDDIQGAIFTHQNKKFIAIPFAQDSIREFFDEDGNSLRKAFLKAPLDFYRISSRFSNARFHPVLKRYRAHHGVDYAAPTGTPVRSIGDGVVVAKAFQKNGGGYYLKIKHNSSYTTSYMHLSKYAKGLEVGKHVKQGEVIAYVGSTGLSTGPHLDFRVYKNNQAIDPLKMESPPSLPIKPELKDSFTIQKELIIKDLEVRKQNSTAAN